MFNPFPKVVVVGDTHVGKTGIITSIRKLPFHDRAVQTVGSASWQVQRNVDGQMCTFEIWDTAGQDAYASLVPFYVRDATVALFCFSVTDPTSLDRIPGWVKMVNDRETIPCYFLVGNKVDCVRSVTEDAANQIAGSINASYFETSAKCGKGIEELLVEIIRALRRIRAEQQLRATRSIPLDDSSNSQPTSGKQRRKHCC
jgi:small GTP-binding protein